MAEKNVSIRLSSISPIRTSGKLLPAVPAKCPVGQRVRRHFTGMLDGIPGATRSLPHADVIPSEENTARFSTPSSSSIFKENRLKHELSPQSVPMRMFDLLDRRRTTGTQSVGEALSEKGAAPLEGTLKLAKYGVPGEGSDNLTFPPKSPEIFGNSCRRHASH